jgi:hypothetical protein
LLLHYDNPSRRNTEQRVCENTTQMQWNRGRLQIESVSIVGGLFLPSPASSHVQCIPKSQMWLRLLNSILHPTSRLTLTSNISFVLALLHSRNQKVERGKVDLDQSVQRVREENQWTGVMYLKKGMGFALSPFSDAFSLK